MTNNAELREGALSLASLGLRIFPIKPGDKTPAHKGWQAEATTDGNQIAKAWSLQPNFNIGIATGEIVCLDLDRHKDGIDGCEVLASWECEHEPLPKTVAVVTGGGGVHLYYRNSAGLDIRNSTGGGDAKGCDVRGFGGFVVAPPSVHPETGAAYKFADGLSPWEIEIAELTQPVLSFIEYVKRKEPKSKGGDHRGGVIPAGQRNGTLFKLGAALRGRGASAETIQARLLETNQRRCSPPLDESEVRTIAASAAGYDPNPDAADLAEIRSVLAECAVEHEIINDSVLSCVFGLCFESCLSYVCDGSNAGEWRRYDGRRWTAEGARGFAAKCCKVFADALLHHLDGLPPGTVTPDMRRAALKYQSERSRAGLLRDAEAELTVSASRFDAVPHLLNCENGVLRFDLAAHAVTFREHRADDYITRLADVEYRPENGNHLFADVLKEATIDRESGDCSLYDFLCQILGVVASGDTSHDCFLLVGERCRSGKSTVFNAVTNMLGDYGGTIDPAALAYNRFRNSASASPDRAAVFGKRLCIGSEPPARMCLDSGFLKAVSGGDGVVTRRLYSEAVTKRMDGLLGVLCNEYPMISDPALFASSRVRCLPFNNQIPEESRDLSLRDRLRESAEKSAILNLCVRGFEMLHDGCAEGESARLEPPEVVRKETERFRRRCDPLQRFLDDFTIEEPGAAVTAKQLFAAYTYQCSVAGAQPLGKSDFYSRLRDRPFWRNSATVNGQTMRRVCVGIALRDGESGGGDGD